MAELRRIIEEVAKNSIAALMAVKMLTDDSRNSGRGRGRGRGRGNGRGQGRQGNCSSVAERAYNGERSGDRPSTMSRKQWRNRARILQRKLDRLLSEEKPVPEQKTDIPEENEGKTQPKIDEEKSVK